MSDSAHEAVETRIRESFARQGIMATLGAELLGVEPGRVRIGLTPGERVCQQNGYVHAGVVATIADSASGYAALTRMPPDSHVLSVEFKINLLSPAIGDRIEATGEVVRAGRTITVTSAVVESVTEGVRKPVAQMQATMMRVDARG